jgi:hypothetical protein
MDQSQTPSRFLDKPDILLTYEQLYIQTYNHKHNLIPERQKCDRKPLFQILLEVPTTSYPP